MQKYITEEKFDGWVIIDTKTNDVIIKGIDHGQDLGETIAKKVAACLNAIGQHKNPVAYISKLHVKMQEKDVAIDKSADKNNSLRIEVQQLKTALLNTSTILQQICDAFKHENDADNVGLKNEYNTALETLLTYKKLYY